MGEGGLLKREPAVNDGLEFTPREEVQQRGQVLAKPVRLSPLQHLDAVDQQPLTPGQQAQGVRRRPPRRRGEQPLEITLATGEARPQPVSNESATPSQRPPGAQKIPATDAVEHRIHAAARYTANAFEEVRPLVSR